MNFALSRPCLALSCTCTSWIASLIDILKSSASLVSPAPILARMELNIFSLSFNTWKIHVLSWKNSQEVGQGLGKTEQKIETHLLTQIRSSDVLGIAITIKFMEELEMEPVELSRGCVHTFSYFLGLQSTHLIHDWCLLSSFGLIHFKKLNPKKADLTESILYNFVKVFGLIFSMF